VKPLLLLVISLVGISACTPQQTAPPPAPMAQPVAATTTNVFDGTYANGVVTAKTPAGCPNLNFPPSLTISNGLALLQGPNLRFSGNVTPQGVLAMSSNSGQTFQGQIDPNFVLRAHVTGPNCGYDVTWSRVS
jgi:hypothetical protein